MSLQTVGVDIAGLFLILTRKTSEYRVENQCGESSPLFYGQLFNANLDDNFRCSIMINCARILVRYKSKSKVRNA